MVKPAEFALLQSRISAPWEWCADIPGGIAGERIHSACARFLRTHASAESDLDGAELIVAELVGNVVRHARGLGFVFLDWSGAQAIISVLDSGPGFSTEPKTTIDDLDAESGRGLAIVRALAGCLTVGNRTGGGGFAHATLPVTRTIGSLGG